MVCQQPFCINCFQLIPTNVALSSMPYFFHYSLLGSDVTTCTFDDLLSPHFQPQLSAVRLSCKPDVIRQFLGIQKPLQVLNKYCCPGLNFIDFVYILYNGQPDGHLVCIKSCSNNFHKCNFEDLISARITCQQLAR